MANGILGALSCAIPSFTGILNGICGGRSARGSAQVPNHQPAAIRNGQPTHRPGTAMTNGPGAANHVFNPADQTQMTPYETRVMELRERIYKQDGETEVASANKTKAERKVEKALEKNAFLRLENLAAGDGASEFVQGAKACLNAMKPEIKDKFMSLLAKEYDLNTGFTEAGISLNEWQDLFGYDGIPYHIDSTDEDASKWELISLPTSLRSVGIDDLRNNDLDGAWSEGGAGHTRVIRDSIMEYGLRLSDWKDWAGGISEGRHRSSAGYCIGNDVLHPLLIRLPLHESAQGQLF